MSAGKSRSTRRDVSVRCSGFGWAVLLTQKITGRKRRGESSHPCLTAVVTGNGSVRVSPWMAWHVNLLYSFRMMVMISGRIPQFLRTSQSTWWSTLSNVSWKSTIVRNIIKHNCKKHFCTLVLIYLWIFKCCILILGYCIETFTVALLFEKKNTWIF